MSEAGAVAGPLQLHFDCMFLMVINKGVEWNPAETILTPSLVNPLWPPSWPFDDGK